MEIILSKQCLSLTGCLGRGYGYFIQRRRSHDGSVRFFSQRSKHPPIPRDGHLRFIFLCAELAQNRLYLSDIRVERGEMHDALREAGYALTLHGDEGLARSSVRWTVVEQKGGLKSLTNMKNQYIQLITAAVLSLGGLIMLFCWVFIEPQGQIYESLLIGFGEVATFAGALFGVDYVYRHRGPRKS